MGLHAHHPLSSPDRLANAEIPFPVSIVFGANDWMDSRGSREIVQLNRHFATGDSNLHVLPDAGHQLFMNNPTGFAELLTADLTGQLKNVFQPQKYRVRYITL